MPVTVPLAESNRATAVAPLPPPPDIVTIGGPIYPARDVTPIDVTPFPAGASKGTGIVQTASGMSKTAPPS